MSDIPMYGGSNFNPNGGRPVNGGGFNPNGGGYTPQHSPIGDYSMNYSPNPIGAESLMPSRYAGMKLPGQTPEGGGMFGENGPNGSTTGWVAPTFGAFSGLANAWMGMKQYDLAKDALKQGKKEFSMNYAAQKNTTNAAMEGQQRALVGATGGRGHTPVAEHMAQYGIA
jgi:hypothetical protein